MNILIVPQRSRCYETICHTAYRRKDVCDRRIRRLVLLTPAILPSARCAAQTAPQETGAPPHPMKMTAQEDHQKMMDLLISQPSAGARTV